MTRPMRLDPDGGPQVPRLVPDEPLPPYPYVPRRGLPHPLRDPRGHSHARAPRAIAAIDPDRWMSSREYRLGIDLFNHGFYWEAHEAWEPLWHAGGRRGPVANFLKGLIKLAAAGVKAREGVPAGTRTHVSRAAACWRDVAEAWHSPGGSILGFRLDALVHLAERIAEEGWPDPPPVLRPGA